MSLQVFNLWFRSPKTDTHFMVLWFMCPNRWHSTIIAVEIEKVMRSIVIWINWYEGVIKENKSRCVKDKHSKEDSFLFCLTGFPLWLPSLPFKTLLSLESQAFPHSLLICCTFTASESFVLWVSKVNKEELHKFPSVENTLTTSWLELRSWFWLSLLDYAWHFQVSTEQFGLL